MNDDEKNIALKKAAEAGAENAFFEMQPEINFYENRIFFEEGFFRGWDHRQPEIDTLTARVAELEGVAK